MRRIDGLGRTRKEADPGQRVRSRSLAEEERARALFLTCSDSRIVPHTITQTQPGDLIICRNAGNIAPPYGETADGVSATIEDAVTRLQVKDIIICGHSDCWAMKVLLNPEKLAGMQNVAAWLKHSDRARVIVEENYSELGPEGQLKTVTEENVVAQLENLKTHPAVAARVLRGDLRLHGWVFSLESGRITAYDQVKGYFAPLRWTGEAATAAFVGSNI